MARNGPENIAIVSCEPATFFHNHTDKQTFFNLLANIGITTVMKAAQPHTPTGRIFSPPFVFFLIGAVLWI